MYHENELLTACRARHKFWDAVGVPKKQRTKFAKWLGHKNATEVWQENPLDDDIYLLRECYKDYKKENGMWDIESSVTGRSTLPEAQIVSNWIDVPGWVVSEQLVNAGSTVTVSPVYNKEEETMDTTYEQRQYLERRLRDVYSTHEGSLRSHFHMDPDFPATPREALDRLAKGTVKFPDAKKLEKVGYDLDGNFHGDIIWNQVDWRTKDADRDGFAAAEKLLTKAFTDAKDIIKVGEPKDGLAALKEFESKTFH